MMRSSNADTRVSGKPALRKTQWFFLGIVSLVVSLLLFLVAEYSVRWRQEVRYGTTSMTEQVYKEDKASGLRLPIRNMHAGKIRTNSHGFRSPEIVQEKIPGVIRLAFLGGSTVWCGAVSSNAHTWPHRAVEKFKEKYPEHQFDYINAGVPGYTLSASLQRWQYQVADFSPDIAIVYHATNDMSANLRELAVADGLLESTTFRTPSWFAQYSLLWDLVEKNYRFQRAQRMAVSSEGRLDISGEPIEKAFHADLAALFLDVQKTSGIVAIPTFTTHLRAEQSAQRQQEVASSALYYMPFMTPQSLLEGYRIYNETIAAVAQETDTLLISGHETVPGNSEHFRDSVHFTDRGAELMAQRVFAGLDASAKFQRVLAVGQ